MPDFTSGLASSYEIGAKAGGGGRFSGLLNYLNSIANEREQKTQTARALDLLGKTEGIKAKIAASPEYQTPKDTAQANLYNAQSDYWKNAANQTGGQSNNLVYRDALTGQEVDSNTALQDIESGNNNYLISKRIMTRSGERENQIVKPPDLTQEEKNYTITSKRLQGRLDSLLTTVLPKLQSGKWNDFQSIQAQSVPYFLIKDKEVQRYKNDLNSLKADIPFLRGGKQLTPTEAKRVDILLNPFGKNPEEFTRDIETFKEEFVAGAKIMKFGAAGMEAMPLKNPGKIQQSNQTLNGLTYTISE